MSLYRLSQSYRLFGLGGLLLLAACSAVGYALPLPQATEPAPALLSTAAPAAAEPLTPTQELSTPLIEKAVPTGPVPDRSLVPTPTDTPSAAGWILIPTPTPAATLPPPPPTPDGLPRAVRVPILMYHYLSTPPPDADIYRRDLSVSPELFETHLDLIEREGYTVISLTDLIEHLALGAPLPGKPVIMTFDDGYRDNYTAAFPALGRRGMTAAFFLVAEFANSGRPEYLTWDMAREMAAAGMSIEAHGVDHASLAGRDDDFLVFQALRSLETIEAEIGVRPRFITYPAGEYDERTMAVFESTGYWGGLTTRQGATHAGDDLFQLHRVRVRGTTTAEELKRLLELDW